LHRSCCSHGIAVASRLPRSIRVCLARIHCCLGLQITDLHKVPFCEWPKSDSDPTGLKPCKDEKCGE
jgi:hypothetical protein